MRRIQLVALFLAVLVLTGAALPSVTARADLSATVIVELLNVRKAPRTSYPVIAQLPRGSVISLVGRNAGGTWVEASGSFGKGWVSAPLISVLQGGEIGTLPITTNAISPFVIIVVYPGAAVRLGPGTTFPVIGTLRQGQAVDVVGQDPRSIWLEVSTQFGIGWIQSQYTNVVGNIFAAPNTDALPVAKNVNYRIKVRSAPSTSASQVGTIEFKGYAQIIGVSKDGKWWKVTGNFGTGWVAASLVFAVGNLSSVPVVAG